MGDVDNPFQQLEAAKKQIIMEFKENAKSAQELEFWNRMEIVRDNYPNSQEDSSSGDTTDEEQVDGENLNKDKKTDEKVPDTASDEETKQEKSAAGERADEEKSLKEHTVTFKIPEMEHGAGDDKPLPQKDFIFHNDGMEHDFNHNATKCESLINSFENEDDNGLGALQLTEEKLEINETDPKNVSSENGYKVGISDLFKAAKKTAKMEAKESEKKRKLKGKELKKRKIEARETERKRKLQEIESKRKMKMEAQESKEKKTREEKEIKKKRKMEKKKAKNQKKYEKCVSKGEEYDSMQSKKEEAKSSQEKIISEAKQSKLKKKIGQN